jgi:hypothetical protein
MGWMAEGSGFESRKGKIFFFFTSSRQVLELTQHPNIGKCGLFSRE